MVNGDNADLQAESGSGGGEVELEKKAEELEESEVN